MGFCLFEHAHTPGIYFAVNPAHLIEVEHVEDEYRPQCRFIFDHKIEDFDPVVSAQRSDVDGVLKDATKIGMNKANLQVISGRNVMRANPLVFQHAPDVMLVREVLADELSKGDGSFVTASTLLFEDGKTRMVVERPGIFARLVNAKGRVPALINDAQAKALK